MNRRKTLYESARDIQGGILESRLVARAETLTHPLTDNEVIDEMQYLLDTIDYSGYDNKYISQIKKACKYILKKGA